MRIVKLDYFVRSAEWSDFSRNTKKNVIFFIKTAELMTKIHMMILKAIVSDC